MLQTSSSAANAAALATLLFMPFSVQYSTILWAIPAASDTDELMQILHRILSREPERTQRIVEMRMEGYSYFEIGKALGISENSARVLFFRIKSKIKEYFEKEGILVD